MAKRPSPSRRDPLEQAIEFALQSGWFISFREGSRFASELEAVASELEALVAADPERAAGHYETFLAGCYAKAEEIDDSGAHLGMFVGTLFCGWIRARQAAGIDADETARELIRRMDHDDYGYAYQVQDSWVKALNAAGRRAFERQARARFDSASAAGDREAAERRCWGDVLRDIHRERRSVAKYVEVCEATKLTPGDCEAIAIMLRARRKLEDALSWVDRGLELEKEERFSTGLNLSELKCQLLEKLGRSGDALESAWAEFESHPHRYTYEELMRYVPRRERASWRARAMATLESAGDPEPLVELCLLTKDLGRLADWLRRTEDAEIERLSHYVAEPAAEKLVRTHPDLAARLFRALAMRILQRKKSRYYDAALSHFADAKRCYEKAGLADDWRAVVAQVRSDHGRRYTFMPGFEALVAGERPRAEPSFLDRAKRRWQQGGE